jgi:hypothetical protein
LAQHENHVSKIMAVSLRMMRKWYKGLRMIVSYSDLNQGHIGGIYQAANWIYVGMARDSAGSLILNGVATHGRSVVAKYGTRNLEWIRTHVDPRARHAETAGKHKYLMPLDDEMRKRIEPLRKPYPKRAGSADSGTSPIQGGRGGATPTPALDSSG